MPFRDDLLNPIAGDNPAGVYLYYDPIYDKLKEARREDLDVAVGDYARDQKVADWNTVIKLAGDAIANKSKDLQLAVWLVEAHLRKEGFVGLRDGLNFLREMISNFWDHLYPQIEDGDMELRATPVEWLGTYLDKPPFPIKTIPLNRAGHGYLKFQESRKIAYEGEGGEAKQEARRVAISEGKLAPEEFDASVAKTPKSFYVEREDDVNACLEALEALNQTCQEKFQDFAPGFGPLRTALEEVRVSVRQLLNKKRETEPDVTVSGDQTEEAVDDTPADAYAGGGATAAAPARRRAVAGLEPADLDEAGLRIAAIAKFMRTQDAYNPAPYLLLRGWRWGELRAGGESPAATLLEAPPGDVRQNIKRLAVESNWQEVLEAAENAMGLSCGRAWLDLQRYTVKACQELGYYYDPIVKAIKSEVRALLADYPGMTDWTLMDDTPTANGETRAWLTSDVLSGAVSTASQGPSLDSYAPSRHEEAPSGEPSGPSAFDLAMNEARSGRKKEAIELLSKEVAQERSGRGRFNRKLQLAQVSLAVGYESIAQSILEELAAEIDKRKLEEWEAPDMVAHPLALLYRSMGKSDGSPELRQKLYAQICRLDPMQALAVSK